MTFFGESINMKWKHEEWNIKQLFDLYEKGKIDLAPDYQRNPIWTTIAQKRLIDTILAPRPMPNFFLRHLGKGNYEMVDGQQRARTIIGFIRNQITSSNGTAFFKLEELDRKGLLRYPLNITLLTELGPGEDIERFYTLVNSSGLRLNTPEIRKAKYHDTRFLALAQSLASSQELASLGLFGQGTIKRMNDVELVSELLALLKYGIGEKKANVEKLYEKDIDEKEEQTLRQEFTHVVGILCVLDKFYRLAKTRYKQRADLYTMFHFIHSHASLSQKTFQVYYNILLTIAPHIRPSQDKCDPLRDYARNCVSQSHSETARRERNNFLCDLLRNDTFTANETQEEIIKFLQLPYELVKHQEAWTIKCSLIEEEQS